MVREVQQIIGGVLNMSPVYNLVVYYLEVELKIRQPPSCMKNTPFDSIAWCCSSCGWYR
jgi:hypothetical protein